MRKRDYRDIVQIIALSEKMHYRKRETERQYRHGHYCAFKFGHSLSQRGKFSSLLTVGFLAIGLILLCKFFRGSSILRVRRKGMLKYPKSNMEKNFRTKGFVK